ncbi:hypothetical protein ACIQNT_39375 [Streptomyces luteogriseus]|uniref:hypothetical protein n=1 Tax=Streptomyces luteogriseus TaxID=68233 RepID=UPI003816E6FE
MMLASTDSQQAPGILFHDKTDRTTLFEADSSERRREKIMILELFRTDRLAENQASSPIEFVVLLGAEQTFLRVIAHLKPNVIHGGTPPTFLITAGLGETTAVDEGTDPVDIPGSGGATVATAACRSTAEDIDTYLVTINHNTPSGPWRVQIKNNEPEALQFVGFISHTEEETLQPWAKFSTPQLLGRETETTHEISVHNIGTNSLIIEDLIGSQLGGSTSPCTIKARPNLVAPHDTGLITVKCSSLEGGRREQSKTFVHTFSTNSLTHSQIRFRVVWPTFPTMCLPDEGCFFGCRDFVPRSSPDEFQCETCFHDAGFHGLPSNDNPFPP